MTRRIGITKSLPASGLLLAAALLVACGGEDGANAAMVVETAPAAETVMDTAAATAAVAEPGFVGTWGTDLAQCAIAQEEERPPMVLRADGYDQHEAHCVFDSVTETGPSQWRVTGQCSVEGDEQPIDDGFAIVDGHLEHWGGDEREYAWTLVRCPQ